MTATLIHPAVPTAAPPANHCPHDVVEIYQRCDCDPDDTGFQATHFVIADVGVTCARGLLYVVCAECCCGENHRAARTPMRTAPATPGARTRAWAADGIEGKRRRDDHHRPGTAPSGWAR